MLSTKVKQRYQTLRLTGANGTIANQIIENAGLQLDKGYNRVTGIAVVVVSDGGIPDNFRVGIRNDRRVWVDPMNVQNWDAADGVAPDQKFLSTDIDYADGEVFYLTAVNQAALTADLVLEMTVRLVGDLTEVNK